MNRPSALDEFYDLLARLSLVIGGARTLGECRGSMVWPPHGVYFFFESREMREDSVTPRVVRVGTHAVSFGSRTTLWTRLRQHRGHLRGRFAGGGNHRGSIFRLLVGEAMLETGTHPEQIRATWGKGSSVPQEVQLREHALELEVSHYIRRMRVLWLPVDDQPGSASNRKVIERGAIALLSNFQREAIDAPSPGWFGLRSPRARVRLSGLWNQEYVDETTDASFLETMHEYLAKAADNARV